MPHAVLGSLSGPCLGSSLLRSVARALEKVAVGGTATDKRAYRDAEGKIKAPRQVIATGELDEKVRLGVLFSTSDSKLCKGVCA